MAFNFIKKIFGKDKDIQVEAQGLLEKYKTITEHITAGVLVFDSAGSVVFASPYTEVLFGHPKSSILSGIFSKIIHPEDFIKHERALKLANVGESFQYRVRVQHSSGLDMHVECRTAPIVADEGTSPYVVSVMLDVTLAVRSERLVEEKNRELREFAYMISHDLRSPLVTLQGMVKILKESEESLSKENKEVLGHITTAINRLDQLIGSVIEYSKVTMLDPAEDHVSLDKIYSELKEDLTIRATSNDVELSIPTTNYFVYGEHTRIYRVLNNLISNAIKYKSPERKGSVSVAESLEGKNIVITITDNGLGIPANMHEAIFKPFQRAYKGNIDGLGIGLASAKKLVERCGGSISVQSSEGVGSTFTVKLLRYNRA